MVKLPLLARYNRDADAGAIRTIVLEGSEGSNELETTLRSRRSTQRNFVNETNKSRTRDAKKEARERKGEGRRGGIRRHRFFLRHGREC